MLTYTNICHILHTKLGIRYDEWNLVLKYCTVLKLILGGQVSIADEEPMEAIGNPCRELNGGHNF